MRIWSLSPKHLDTKGLVALWRETLLAKHVLEGKTKGYTNHPQLDRFKNTDAPLDAINFYLKIVYEESLVRGYKFDNSKFDLTANPKLINVTIEQVQYELKHLQNKLKLRAPSFYNGIKWLEKPEVHPLFIIVDGPIENWEKM